MENIKEKIINWNVRFPIDRLWRKKYSIPFNSTTHKESNFIDQLFDIEEDKLFEELINREEYVPNVGDWLKPQIQKSEQDSIEALRDEFKDLEDDGQDN